VFCQVEPRQIDRPGLGVPATTVPAGFTADGRPVGLQVGGRLHADAEVLQAAACFEAARPWADHKPAV
jgi:aspartyl-tRNA(Asn)/glutamyl-tRNA(Gln) amidotransferase subunit A